VSEVNFVHVLGLCKFGATCTAHMAVAVNVMSHMVSVSFCRHHVGHDLELRHLRLSTATRLEVAAMLQQGGTVTGIMDTMRDRLGQTRDHLICRYVELTPMCHSVQLAC